MKAEPFSRARRFGVAALALALGAFAFRAPIADALVSRGDAQLVGGAPYGAIEYYARALRLDPHSGTAADRYAFAQFERHTSDGYALCIAGASRYLASVPADARLLRDRALCRLRRGQFARARADFDAAFSSARDAQDAVFAGWAALRDGDVRAARSRWLAALRVQPGNVAARIALGKHR